MGRTGEWVSLTVKKDQGPHTPKVRHAGGVLPHQHRREVLSDHRHHGLFVIFGRGLANARQALIGVNLNKNPISPWSASTRPGNTHDIRVDRRYLHGCDRL